MFPEQVGSDAGAALAPATPGCGSRRGASSTTSRSTQRLPATESLEALLTRTIDAVFAGTPQDRAIALALLSRDRRGRLPDTLRRSRSPPASARRPTAVERVLRACQDLAPTGIFARSLAECLELQLAERDRLTPPMQTLLANLPRLAAGDRAALAALCGVGRDGLDELVAEIRALDPKPGLAFTHELVSTLIPDVFVRAAPAGGWIVELNDEVLPRLLVNRAYYAQVSARVRERRRPQVLR